MFEKIKSWIVGTGTTVVSLSTDFPQERGQSQTSAITIKGSSIPQQSVDSEDYKPSIHHRGNDIQAERHHENKHTPDHHGRIPILSISANERKALYMLAGHQYVISASHISEAQQSVLQRFQGFDWTTQELAYWKKQFEKASARVEPSVSRDVYNTGTNPRSLEKNYHRITDWNQYSPAKDQRVDSVNFSLKLTDKMPHPDQQPGLSSLNQEQQRTFDFIENSRANVFITGRAGSGKSHLLRFLSQSSSKENVVVAPTGVAALNAGGVTIHKMFRLPWGFLNDKLVEEALRNIRVANALVLRNLNVLIIDEVSMVPADMLLAIDIILRKIREIDSAFGGVQVVMFGDPYQLEPVVKERALKDYYTDVWGSPFFFSSPAWKSGRFEKIELTESLRQSDSNFLEVLDAIRQGTARFSHLELLYDRVFEEEDIPHKGTVRLSSTNSAADRFNRERLGEIRAPLVRFIGSFDGEFDRSQLRSLAPEFLDIKLGAQVMMLANHRSGCWFNGSMAQVAELTEDEIWIEIDHAIYPVDRHSWTQIRHKYNRMEASIDRELTGQYTQFPMSLGWARTIHKAQGQTYDKCAVDLAEGVFANGQSYVALSRSRSLKGLYLNHPLEFSDIRVSSDVRAFMSDLIAAKDLML